MEIKVMIGVPTNEMARHSSFYDYLELLEKPENTFSTRAHGQSPARNRNLIIQEAIDKECTHVLLIDDDIIVKSDLLIQLLEHDVDIVSALALMRNYPHPPLAFTSADEMGKCLFTVLPKNESGLIEVVATGLGCILIKTSIFDKLERPWIRLGELESDEWCDDIGFFKRVREAGIKIYCDLDAQVGHVTSVVIWPNQINGNWYTSYDSQGRSRLNTPQIESNEPQHKVKWYGTD